MGAQTLSALVRREYCYVVDLQTMKIVDRFVGTTDGSKPNGVNSSIQLAIARGLQLLGN